MTEIVIRGVADVNRILADLAPSIAKNLMRTTVYDIAKTAADIVPKYTPDDPATGVGDLHTSIKAVRGRGSRTTVDASVNVMNTRRNFFWRFLEYGDGPDHVEYAMFLKTLEELRPNIERVYLEAFAKKLIARLQRERNRAI